MMILGSCLPRLSCDVKTVRGSGLARQTQDVASRWEKRGNLSKCFLRPGEDVCTSGRKYNKDLSGFPYPDSNPFVYLFVYKKRRPTHSLRANIMDGTLTQNECDSRFVAGQRGVRYAYPWSRWDRRDVKTLSSDSGWSTSQIKAVSPRVAHVIMEAVLCTFPEPQPPPLKALALWFVCKSRLLRIQDPLVH